MCANCLSAFEASVVQTAGAAIVAQQAWHRARDFVAGWHPAARAQVVYDGNAAFVESLGLDAAGVLGERPVVPATQGALAPLGLSTWRVGGAPAAGFATLGA